MAVYLHYNQRELIIKILLSSTEIRIPSSFQCFHYIQYDDAKGSESGAFQPVSISKSTIPTAGGYELGHCLNCAFYIIQNSHL
jgi:hypothetical protein